MSKLRVSSFSISLDGFGAGPNQDLENPLGVGGKDLHKWVFGTQTFQKLFGNSVGSTGIDNDFAVRGFENIGAWIMGRNLFGPIRGAWPDQEWKGWWGNNPPIIPLFLYLLTTAVLQLKWKGNNILFVTDGIASALKKAKEAAKGKDIRVGGGVATIREYLKAGLIDDMHLAISPLLLGSGEHLLQGIDLKKLGYRCIEHVPTETATHVVIGK